jgi:ribosome biogenesis GTPase
LDFPEIEPRSLGYFFPEMISLIPGCRFSSCVHYREPDCAVKAAVGPGNTVDPKRYENYVVFLEEIFNRERRY